MYKKISEKYQKVLVTVAMGFRTEDDIIKNGLYRFSKNEERALLDYVISLFNINKSVLALKVNQIGYRSEHINITSKNDLDNFIKNISNIYEKDNEVWIVSSSIIECWRCRIYLSNYCDIIEMAYSYDDHILDHLNSNLEVPYVCYKRYGNNFKIINTNIKEDNLQFPNIIMKDILFRYSNRFKEIKRDLDFIGLNGISLDVRVNNGYDFHDFDVEYGSEKKVIDYYLSELKNIKKL